MPEQTGRHKKRNKDREENWHISPRICPKECKNQIEQKMSAQRSERDEIKKKTGGKNNCIVRERPQYRILLMLVYPRDLYPPHIFGLVLGNKIFPQDGEKKNFLCLKSQKNLILGFI